MVTDHFCAKIDALVHHNKDLFANCPKAPLQTMSVSPGDFVPAPGQWPVDPQDDVPIREDRIWVDGCFDFSHHGEKAFSAALKS